MKAFGRLVIEFLVRAAVVVLLCSWLMLLGVSFPVHAASGDLDPTFGIAGKVTTDFGAEDRGLATALQSDGKIVAAGWSFAAGDFKFALARYNQDGSLDPTFGSGGKLLTDFGGFDDIARAVAVQSDGRILAAGHSRPVVTRDFALARYNSDGTLDPTFGAGGKVTTEFGGTDEATAIVIQPDGRILVAGGSNAGGTFDFVLARYNANGTLDATFGPGGKVTTSLGGHDVASAMALQLDGAIVAAGFSDAGGSRDFALARYNPNGTLDSTFGPGGMVTTDFGGVEVAAGVAIQPDGAIVAVGNADFDGTFNSNDFVLARYNPDGSLDPTFGTGGRVITDFGGRDLANAVALQSDGAIVAAGFATLGSNFDVALARYNPDGSLDPSFGAGGKVTTDFGASDDRAFAVAIQPDGNIVAAGFSDAGGTVDFALTRYGAPGAVTVTIDIRPGSFPNSINLGSGGNVPVAIFSASGFDATTVDPLTVTLASAPVQLRGKGTPNASFQDVNGDGLVDLVVHVDTSSLTLSETDTGAVLAGETFGGQTISGADSVRVVP